MKRSYALFAVAATCIAIPQMMSAATWKSAASGNYSWTDTGNWDAPPTSSTDATFGNVSELGRQIISGDGVASTLDVNTRASSAREFQGAITANKAVFRTGTNEISGTLTLTDSSAGYSRVGTSSTASGSLTCVLDILSGGALVAEGPHAIYVGRNNSDNSPASGRIRLRDGGSFLLNTKASSSGGLLLGVASGSSTAAWFASSYVQDGGDAKIGRMICGGERNACAAMAVAGGVLELPFLSQTQFKVGHMGYGIFQQLGGVVYVNTNNVQQTLDNRPTYAFEVGSGLSAANGLTNAAFYATAGSFVNGSSFLIQGPGHDETGVMPASATIDGTAIVTSRTVRVGANAGDGRASLNLNGGHLSTFYLRGLQNRAGISEINADGGMVSFPSGALENQFVYLNSINIFPGGLTVRCDANINFGTANAAAPLRTPVGAGLESIVRDQLGACVYPPRIEISGGSGSNATAIALIDYNRHQLTNVVVTCRGEGYQPGDELTVKVIRLNTSNPEVVGNATCNLAENTPGTLVKTGSKNLKLYAQPEFDGVYEVRAGRMIQQTTAAVGSTKVGAVVVGGEGAVFQCGTADASATVAKSNPINPRATLTLGTSNGPGALSIPAAADGESAAFEQAFASLTVSGTGNAVVMAAGNNAANGAKVKFGTVDCPAGAELTIPRWDSPLKVYVTGHPARTVFRHIRFADTGLYAKVADDGQLIPVSGFSMSIR